MLYSVYEELRKVHYAFAEEKEVLRGPMEIRPTKTTNLISTIATARNTLTTGHRFRGDVGEAM